MRTTRRVLVDSNVLVYRSSIASPFHRVATNAMDDLATSGVEFATSAQVVREFLRAMLKSRPNQLPLESRQLVQFAMVHFGAMVMLEETPGTLARLYELCLADPGALWQVHDTNIAATMLEHDVTEMLTNNVRHFKPLEPLITVLSLQGQSL